MHNDHRSRRAKIKAKIRGNELKIQQLEHQIELHHERFVETMLIMFRDADKEGQQKLEEHFLLTTGQSLAKLYEQRVIESLINDTHNVP